MNRKAVRGVVAGVLLGASSIGGIAWANADGAPRQRLHMLWIEHDGVEETITAHAAGPIRGHGTVTEEEHIPTPEGPRGQLTLHFDDGTVSVSFVERNFQQNFDPQACAAAPSARATLTITGGTGAYAGAKGTLEATREGRIIGARGENGECIGRSAPPKVVVMRVDAVGTASI
jgi:hypothetical protein